MPPSGLGAHNGLSGTRIRLFNECALKWWYQYSHKGPRIVPASTKNQGLGTCVHWIAEHWLRDGIPPQACPLHPDPEVAKFHVRAIPIFAAGAKYWPAPKLVKVEFPTSVTIAGQAFTGSIDVLDEKGHCLNLDSWPQYGSPGWLGYNLPVVGDHKSTKSAKYVKTPDELRADEQVISYGKRVAELTGASVVVFQWVYYLTEGAPAAFPVRFAMTAQELDRGWQKVTGDVQAAIDVANEPDLYRVPRNLATCYAYGGCPFRERCQDNKEQVSMGTIENSSLFKKVQAQGINPPSTAPVTAPVTAVPEVVATVPASAVVATPVPAVAPAARGSVFAKAKPAAAPAPSPTVQAPPSGGSAETPKVPSAPAPAPEATPEPEAKPKRAKAPAAKSGLIVCVDCQPSKGLLSAMRELVDVAQPAMASASAEAQAMPGDKACGSYRLVDFGKGPGLLAAHFERQIETSPLDGVILVDSDSFEGRALLPVLVPLASIVIRGRS